MDLHIIISKSGLPLFWYFVCSLPFITSLFSYVFPSDTIRTLFLVVRCYLSNFKRPYLCLQVTYTRYYVLKGQFVDSILGQDLSLRLRPLEIFVTP